jgi:hypothetical protein
MAGISNASPVYGSNMSNSHKVISCLQATQGTNPRRLSSITPTGNDCSNKISLPPPALTNIGIEISDLHQGKIEIDEILN